MKSIKNIWWAYAGVILFIALNTILVSKEFYLFSLAPLVLLLVAGAFLSLDKLLLAVVFMVPLSVPLSEVVKGLPIDMFLPSEPLLAGILLIFIVKILYEKRFDKDILFHPVTIAIYFYLGWTLITSLTSTLPLVSIKFFISKLWFIVAFYFLASQLFRNPQNAKRYVLYYAFAFVIVVFYALARHAFYGIFDEKIAHWSANPFYKDHTSYGALLALYAPLLVGMTFHKGYSTTKRLFYAAISFILLTGLIFSYSRAAWLGLIAAFGVWVLIKLKIKFSLIFFGIAIFTTVIFAFGDNIMQSLERNDQESSTDLAAHVRSISNITSDASNLERLNRWNCAIRMFKEKPLFGWGPGTYMFQYAPFQFSHEKTIISTRKGDAGNAHSEYLGPLSEQGVLGPILFVVIIILTVITGLRAIKNTANKELKMLGLFAIVGLFSYYLHGIVNNFLDTDKASVPFWGFSALLVAIDVYHRKQKAKE